MKKLVSAVLLTSGLLAFGDDVATLEAGLKSDILDKVNQVNPIDSATGQRKYISFAMISDIHKCKRVSGDDATTNPVTTYWYGSAGCLTEAEQSIRLLGSLAVDAGLDAVINGGDMSTAPIMGDGTLHGLTEAEYTNEIWNVKAMFDQYLPATVPLFTIDGNHERSYSKDGADMHMSDDAWAYVLTNFNTSASVAQAHNVDVTYHRDLAAAKLGDNATGAYTGNSYHLDFRRLVASGGSNVRIACVSMYDGATGANPAYRVYDAAQFYDASGNLIDSSLTPANTVIGMVAHGSEASLDGTMARGAAGTLMNGFMNGYSNAKDKIGPWNLGTQGKAFFGLVAAHFHYTNSKVLTDAYDEKVNGDNKVYASAVSVSSAYAVNYPAKPSQHQLGTDQAYHFSIFVVDTDNNLLHEVRVGGIGQNTVHEVPVVQLYNTNIRTHLGQSAQTAPTLGTVTVTPVVTNATLSGAISSLGSGATACDVYLAYGTSANNLGAATKIAEGATASFSYVISNLTAETTYYYSLSISNNAETVMGAAKSGNFTTGAEPVEPGPETHVHTWGDASYVWSADNATCTGSATCIVDSAHVTNETVTATYAVVQAATTEATGTGRYTAVFPGAPFATQTKDVTIPKVIPPPQPGEGIQPGETAAETRQTIQDAIDAAVPTQGTVTLGNGLFDIDAQLNVTGGVTLVGQGWTNTTIRFADTKAGSENRVANIDGGSVLAHVTLTGGKVDNNNKSGGGAYLTDGTISWCCITNNYAKRSYGGGGVFISGTGTAKIDHTIIADNSAATAFLNGIGGGIGIRGRSGLRVEIDACLVYGNTAGASDRTSHGGGIAVTGVDASDSFTTVIRNTTIANNSVVGAGLGGGLYIDQADTTLINCLVSGNTADATATAGDANVAYKDATIMSAVADKTTTCLFGGTPLFVDAASGDYHLAENSPAIEAGTDYAGLEKDLDGKYFSYLKPAIGCYEYGEYGPRPADEWDIPGTNGGIRGIDDGQGGKFIAFTAIARDGETVAVGFRAAEIGASVGASFALICKDNLADTATFTIDATLTEVASPLGVLEAATDKAQIFVVGIGAADNN